MARPIDPEKRQAILQSARTIFVRDGFQAAKVSVIAQDAGVASGTVYLYFSSKEAITEALATEFFERAIELMTRLLPQIADEDGLERYIDAMVLLADKEKDLLAQIKPDPSRAEDEFSRCKRFELNEVAANALEKLMEEGKIRRYDKNILASLMFGMLHSIVMGAVVFNDRPLAVYRDTAASMLRLALEIKPAT